MSTFSLSPRASSQFRRDGARSLPTSLGFLACVALASVVLGFANAHYGDTVALFIVAVVMSALAILRPRFLLLSSIPLTIIVGGLTDLGVLLSALLAGALLCAGALGVVTRRFPLVPRAHVIILLLSIWLAISHLTASSLLRPVTSPDADLATFLMGLAVCACAALFRPEPSKILVVTGATSLVVSYQAFTEAGARAAGFTLNPNYLAVVIVLGIVAFITLARRNPLWLLGSALGVPALIATQSRGGFLTLVAGIGVALITRRNGSLNRLVLGGAAFILVILLQWTDPIGQSLDILNSNRGTADIHTSDTSRAQAASYALQLSLKHPLTGIGYGLFPIAAASDSQLGIYFNTHNDYLRLSSETGVPGLLLFLALVGTALSPRMQSDARSLGKPLIVAYLFGLLFANTLANLIVTIPFWVMLGSMLGELDFIRRSSNRATPVGKSTEDLAQAVR